MYGILLQLSTKICCALSCSVYETFFGPACPLVLAFHLGEKREIKTAPQHFITNHVLGEVGNEGWEASAMNSSDGEKVAFIYNVACSGAVELWLTRVETCMRETLKKLLQVSKCGMYKSSKLKLLSGEGDKYYSF